MGWKGTDPIHAVTSVKSIRTTSKKRHCARVSESDGKIDPVDSGASRITFAYVESDNRASVRKLEVVFYGFTNITWAKVVGGIRDLAVAFASASCAVPLGVLGFKYINLNMSFGLRNQTNRNA